MQGSSEQLKVPQKSLPDAFVELLRATAASVPVVATFGAMVRTNQEVEMGHFFQDVARMVNAVVDDLSELSLFIKAKNGDEKAAEIIVKSWRRLAVAFTEAHDEVKKDALKAAAVLRCGLVRRR